MARGIIDLGSPDEFATGRVNVTSRIIFRPPEGIPMEGAGADLATLYMGHFEVTVSRLLFTTYGRASPLTDTNLADVADESTFGIRIEDANDSSRGFGWTTQGDDNNASPYEETFSSTTSGTHIDFLNSLEYLRSYILKWDTEKIPAADEDYAARSGTVTLAAARYQTAGSAGNRVSGWTNLTNSFAEQGVGETGIWLKAVVFGESDNSAQVVFVNARGASDAVANRLFAASRAIWFRLRQGRESFEFLLSQRDGHIDYHGTGPGLYAGLTPFNTAQDVFLDWNFDHEPSLHENEKPLVFGGTSYQNIRFGEVNPLRVYFGDRLLYSSSANLPGFRGRVNIGAPVSVADVTFNWAPNANLGNIGPNGESRIFETLAFIDQRNDLRVTVNFNGNVLNGGTTFGMRLVEADATADGSGFGFLLSEDGDTTDAYVFVNAAFRQWWFTRDRTASFVILWDTERIPPFTRG